MAELQVSKSVFFILALSETHVLIFQVIYSHRSIQPTIFLVYQSSERSLRCQFKFFNIQAVYLKDERYIFNNETRTVYCGSGKEPYKHRYIS